ncbi:AMP-binding enzyme/Ankyrin repeat/Ankyrin repeats (3 copies)/Ankyrin repeats (many copies) [Novymonas esmeraldas]|uniref:AMP-binding enzyme/Ankyrin repeat/Ankyrin repeats (3 copies)/Ankyrin repeats (Many copies) n=1 Tax=Novymonas esmeraldas TaxID=1808958 RepID=A0AAW0EZC5_9TRYP
MRSDTPGCGSSGRTLSACILAALQERGDDEIMFELHQHALHDAVTATRHDGSGEASAAPERVTKRIWCAFARLLQQHLGFSAQIQRAPLPSRTPHGRGGEAAGTEEACDVGLCCSEVFHVCLVESVCLCMGWTFCIFRPDDPPLRLERLVARRRPRRQLRLEEIASLLRAAHAAADGDAGASRCSDAAVVLPPVEEMDDGRVAYYMYTSGSTGDPKCVVASRGNLRSYLQRFVLHGDGLAAATVPCRFFCLSSPFFDPSIGDMLIGLCTAHGVFCTCPQAALLNGWAAPLLASAQPTHVVSTPAVWSSLTVAGQLPLLLRASTAACVRVFLGGERMSQAIIDTWAGVVELYNIYGVTEATIYQSVRRVRPGARAATVRCGPGVGTRIGIQRLDAAAALAVVGDDDDADAAVRETSPQRTPHSADGGGVGEVVLFGDQVCCGYAEESVSSPFGCDPATGERFFRTGDVGRLVSEADGGPQELELRGRRDWQLKLNGQRVALEEVESTVQRALGGLALQCACFCVPGAAGSPTIGLAVVLADVVDAALLREHEEGVVCALRVLLALHLPFFMLPCHWRVFASGASLPQTPTGKVNRAQLTLDTSDECREGAETPTCPPDPGNPGDEDDFYRAVQTAWQSALGVPVRADTHYLHAGGDSLGALKLSRAVYLALHNGCDAGIDERGGLPAPFQPHILFQHPRFGNYVRAIRAAHITENNGDSMQAAADGAEATPAWSAPLVPVLDPDQAASDFRFREVVAVQSAALAGRLLSQGLAAVNAHNSREHRCITPLHVAVASCRAPAHEAAALRTVEVLLQHGARLTAVTPDGVTAAHLASVASVALLQRLLEHDRAVVHCRDTRQQSLLHFAARTGNAETTRLLLRRYGLRVETRDKWQRTPAHWAVLNGHTAVLEEMSSYCSTLAATQVATEAVATCEGHDGTGAKRQRSTGVSTARLTRLARKKTYLAYETLHEIAERVHPTDDQMRQLCDTLAPFVGEAALPAL